MTIYGFFRTIMYEVRELETDSQFTNTTNADGDLIEEISTKMVLWWYYDGTM